MYRRSSPMKSARLKGMSMGWDKSFSTAECGRVVSGAQGMAEPTQTRPLISVVVPVYGCANCLRELHRQIDEHVSPLSPSWELILINDASPDDSWAAVQELA